MNLPKVSLAASWIVITCDDYEPYSAPTMARVVAGWQLSGWATDADFVERMSRHVAREAKDLSFVGDEWSDAQSLVEAGGPRCGPRSWDGSMASG